MTPASAATQPDVTPHYENQSQRYNIKAVLEIADNSASARHGKIQTEMAS